MAIYPDDSKWKNRHTLAIGVTGSGKTYWLQHHPIFKGSGKRVIIWDCYESHTGHTVRTIPELARALKSAVSSGKGFKIVFSGKVSRENFEAFCAASWIALDGRKETIILIEELADVTSGGKASDAFGQLIRVGRKYGAVVMCTTQRAQEIPKTLFTQVSATWAGYVKPYDRTYVERNVGIDPGGMGEIQPESYLFFYSDGKTCRLGGPGKPKIKLF